jgi:hypothetical protein
MILNINDLFINKHLGTEYWSFQDNDKFINYFFPENIKISINDKNNYDADVFSIYETDNSYFNKNKINIIICVENASHHSHYHHYNKYGDYNNDLVQIYIYNHIDKIVKTDKYIAIPVIYTQINYFKRFYKTIQPSIYTPFNKKKFCLFVSNNGYLSEKKNKIKDFLNSIEQCDSLDLYKDEVKNKSCYHSVEFLNVLNRYKFVFVSENSYNDGYITEKIFNCFFARTIPVYHGSPKINYYFNNNTFINVNDLSDEKLEVIKQQIIKIKDNENEYNNIININKINSGYDDENYKIQFKKFVNKLLNKNNICTKLNKFAILLIIIILIFIFIFICIKYSKKITYYSNFKT